MTAITNVKNLRQYKGIFSVIVVQILAFAWSPNMVREIKNLSSNFKQIAWLCFILLSIVIQIATYIFSLNFKQSHEKLFLSSLYLVDITCHFL